MRRVIKWLPSSVGGRGVHFCKTSQEMCISYFREELQQDIEGGPVPGRVSSLVTRIPQDCGLRTAEFFFFLHFLGSHLRHMEGPRLGVELELQLRTYTTATAMPHPSHLCSLPCSLRQCQILNL